jgi:hypothetical protein
MSSCKKTRRNDAMKEFNPVTFKHLKNDDGKLFCTVCTIELPNATLIGVAICSSRDQFCRKTGRELAAKRARIAMMSLRNTLRITNCRESTWEVPVGHENLIPSYHKSIYIPKEQTK